MPRDEAASVPPPRHAERAYYDSAGNLEIVEREGIRVKRMRVTKDQLSGTGERLGIAYRLKSGEMVYVPERGTRSSN